LKLDPPHLGFDLRVEVELLAAEQVWSVLDAARRGIRTLALEKRGNRCVSRTLLEIEDADAALLLGNNLLRLRFGAR